jgi:hypothetical protein
MSILLLLQGKLITKGDKKSKGRKRQKIKHRETKSVVIKRWGKWQEKIITR